MLRTFARKMLKDWRKEQKALLEKYSRAQMLTAFIPTAGKKKKDPKSTKQASAVLAIKVIGFRLAGTPGEGLFSYYWGGFADLLFGGSPV